jgi:hypothetical protein
MRKANLLCPKERVFFRGLLVSRPSIPTERTNQKEVVPIEVDVLEEVGEKALVLLPNLMSYGESRTALVNVQYLV